MKTIYSNNI